MQLTPFMKEKMSSPPQDEIDALVNLYQSDQMTKTEQACRELLQTYPQSLIAINVLGATLQGQGKLQEAVQAYDKAIQLKPDFAEAHSNRGITLKDLGRLDEAVESYDKAIQLKPDLNEAYGNLGDVYLFQGLNKKGLRMKRFGEHVISFDASNGINILGRNENESN